MKLRTAVAMLLLLGGILLFNSYYLKPKEEARAKEKFLFASQPPGQFERITITKSGESFELYGSEKGMDDLERWKITDKAGQVEVGALRRLVILLKELQVEDPIDRESVEASPSDFGLSPPEATIRVQDKQGVQTLELGLFNQMIGKRYLRVVEKRDTYVISDELYRALGKGVTDFRNRTPVKFQFGEVTRVTYRSPGGEVVLEQRAPQQWRMTAPQSVRAGVSSVESFLRELTTLKVEKFLDGKAAHLASTKLAAPEFRVSLELNEGQVLELALATATDGGVYFTVGDLDVVFYDRLKNAAEQFQRKPDDFRETRYFAFDSKVVKALRFEQLGEGVSNKLEVVRSEGDWVVGGKKGDGVFIEDTLSKLSRLKASGFPAPGEGDFGFTQPKVTISVELSDSEASGTAVTKTQKLVVGNRRADGQYYAATDDLSEPFLIAPESFEALVPREEKLLPVSAPSPTASS